jgi:hypothetical protein
MRTSLGHRLSMAALAAVLLATFSIGLASASTRHEKLERARDATDKFHNIQRAIDAGYGLPPTGPLHECISSLDNTGAMGFHYINGGLLDGKVQVRKPEALVYAPDEDGDLRLVALEYVVFADAWTGEEPPMLFGKMFMFTPSPNRYEIPAFYSLHAWVWKHNPAGKFKPFNRRVSCDNA